MPRASRRDGWTLLASLLRLVLVAGIIVTTWSVVRLAPWSQSSAWVAPSTSPVPLANVNPVGVNTFLAGEVEIWKRERTIEMVADMGAGWIRQGFPWNEIEPQQGEHWDARYQQDAWKKFDNIVDLAEEHGVRIIARLDQTPQWARPPGTDPNTPPSDFEDYGDFVYDLVSRYRGRISFIQIWNEPNLAVEWGGEINPAGYADLLEIAARRAREADPDIVILSAPMAMTTEDSDRAIDEFTYWQALYDEGVAPWFDVMSANVYGLDDPFDAPPDPTTLNTRRVEILRELAVRNGDENKAIWFNEYGWNASPADFPADKLIWSRVDDSTQADWTARGIEYGETHWDWFGVASIWYFRHVGNIPPDRSDYYFRMVDVEFTPRDVYREVQRLSDSMRVASVGQHAMLAASVTSFGRWPIERDAAFKHGYAIQGTTGSSLEIRFEGSALDIHLPPASSQGSVRVTVSPGMGAQDTNTETRSIPIPQSGGFLTLTDDLIAHPSPAAASSFTVHLEVSDGSILLVDQIRVRYERSYTQLLTGISVLAGASAGLFGLSRRGKNP